MLGRRWTLELAGWRAWAYLAAALLASVLTVAWSLTELGIVPSDNVTRWFALGPALDVAILAVACAVGRRQTDNG